MYYPPGQIIPQRFMIKVGRPEGSRSRAGSRRALSERTLTIRRQPPDDSLTLCYLSRVINPEVVYSRRRASREDRALQWLYLR